MGEGARKWGAEERRGQGQEDGKGEDGQNPASPPEAAAPAHSLTCSLLPQGQDKEISPHNNPRPSHGSLPWASATTCRGHSPVDSRVSGSPVPAPGPQA